MGRMVYVTNVTVDGYIENTDGVFDIFPPDDEVFAAATDLVQSVGTFVYGRRLYESMAVWETMPELAAQSELTAEFARAWQAAAKVVYSTTLDGAPTANTRVERRFDPAAVQELKAAADRDLMLGGADLAGQALAAGLVDEVQLFVWPGVVGGGKPGFPLGTAVRLELLDDRRFANGVLLLRYGVQPAAGKSGGG
jgi:dihydrofolate reductase